MLHSVATLKNLVSGAQLHLAARHLVGRSKNCHLCIARPNISGVHAEIVWTGGSWQIQDLGSRNGTFIDGRKLSAGEQAALVSGTELVFGVPDNRFQLVDDSPPRLMAISDTDEVRMDDGEILCLPTLEECEVSIFRGADDRWRLETDHEVRVLVDQEIVVAGGLAWRICLPSLTAETRDAKADVEPAMAEIGLEFFVSRDGEHVTMMLDRPSDKMPLEPRAHAFLLLTLARCRLNDAEQSDLPETEHGWVYREDLIKMLAITDPHLINLWVHRARRQLAEAGVRGAAGIVERRAGAQQMRIGVKALQIS